MEAASYDDLEEYKDKIMRLRGALSRTLLSAIAFRVWGTYPDATHLHIVQYPDNVYRVWAVASGGRWVTVCEDDVAPTWTSINLDADIDLVIRLAWTKRITTYTRRDGVEVHSLSLFPLGSSKRKMQDERAARARRMDERKAPPAQDGGPSQELGRSFGEAGQAVGQYHKHSDAHELRADDGAGFP